MAECNWCDSKAWFFQLNRSGLCADCDPEVQADVLEHSEALDAAGEPAAGADWQTRLAHYDGIREHLRALLRYEGRGIPTLDPAPSAALAACGDARAKVILEAAGDAVETALAQAEAAETPAAGMTLASEALAQVKAFQNLLGEALPEFGDNDATVLVRLQKKVEAYIGGQESA